MYSDKVMEEFKDPKNLGEMESPDAVGKVGNPTCGDLLWVYIKVDKKNGKKIIKDIKVKTFGCVAAIANSSMLTQVTTGMTFKEAKKLTKQEIADKLGGLPKEKMHCSTLALDGLKKAIENYEKSNK